MSIVYRRVKVQKKLWLGDIGDVYSAKTERDNSAPTASAEVGRNMWENFFIGRAVVPLWLLTYELV